jgi:hypothetical protein
MNDYIMRKFFPFITNKEKNKKELQYILGFSYKYGRRINNIDFKKGKRYFIFQI